MSHETTKKKNKKKKINFLKIASASPSIISLCFCFLTFDCYRVQLSSAQVNNSQLPNKCITCFCSLKTYHEWSWIFPWKSSTIDCNLIEQILERYTLKNTESKYFFYSMHYHVFCAFFISWAANLKLFFCKSI